MSESISHWFLGAESFIDIEIDQCGSEISYSSCSDNLLEEWRPLLIIIPLRLGLTTINPCYLPAIQVSALRVDSDLLF